MEGKLCRQGYAINSPRTRRTIYTKSDLLGDWIPKDDNSRHEDDLKTRLGEKDGNEANYVNIEFSYLLCTHLVIYYTFFSQVRLFSSS